MAVITPEVYSSMGLRPGEYESILSLLGREPTLTELGMFAVMWSEHCGYKYSRPVLAYFKRYKEALEGKGFENAGVVDIGDGLGVTMKVESHNHPSAVEPYQGAATGVGGIIRDILTMGARPIASLNSLRFGPVDGEGSVVERNRYLFEHVVAGIAGYGNCVGVPTVAGEVGFHERYSGNPLVNAMCVGIVPLDQITTAAAAGEGNPVLYLGSATGKDGIHGATFASTELDEESEAKRPNVQIGDPFAEKLLIEATLEALRTGAVVAIQDMGAAGLTCSTVEMASKGDVGMRIDLDLVPMRETDMSAYELMLSESQERMLAVAERGREHEVLDIFRRWGLAAEIIGEVTSEPVLTVTRRGRVEAQLDPRLLTDHCPTYSTPAAVPEYHLRAQRFDPEELPSFDPQKALLKLLSSPNIASKRWVFRQYDQQVQTQTALLPGQADAAVLAPRGTAKGLSVKIDGNARHVYFDPYVGGLLAVVEAARNVACTGALPRAVTDGLNFGNPEDPYVFWQFRESVRGIADAAEVMGTPVISGNVSFYNESELGEVLPTPLIGMLGVLERAETAIGMAPRRDRGALYLLSTPLSEIRQSGLGASEYAAAVHGLEDGLPVAPDVSLERSLCELLVLAVAQGWIESAHDTSEGGLAVALAEIALSGDLGIQAEVADSPAALFGEVPGRVVVSALDADSLGKEAESRGLKLDRLGSFDRRWSDLRLGSLHVELDACREAYESAIPAAMRH
ncbi:MAG TPA: phosphoribosylformylglycinamidine synthase subunit PurL [Fimbriimonadaceae bacterium]|nr:phosphoribosylformylglycinamidine synthase subunit PurL [Fimbriimonadaceae bacterium]